MAKRDALVAKVKTKKTVEMTLTKDEHAGETVRIGARPINRTTILYFGTAGSMRIAEMEMRLPIGGLAQVTRARVARDYWRNGIAKRIYQEINADLDQIGAKLEPHWGAMTPDSLNFWIDFGGDDPELVKKLEADRTEWEESGKLEEYDAMGKEMHWNGDPAKPEDLV